LLSFIERTENGKLITIGLALISFGYTPLELSTHKFKYPKKKGAELKIDIPKEWEIVIEKRDQDLYYSNFSDTNGDQILLSVLFYKLNDIEKEPMEEIGLNNPIIPYAFFIEKSRTTALEENANSWNNEDFYFLDTNIEAFNSVKAHQKNIKAYCMYDFDLFVQIHLSKLNYTVTDSIQMMSIVNTLVK